MCKLSEYVFEGKDGECKQEICKHKHLMDYQIVPLKNITEFLNAVALWPVTVAI